MYKVRWAGYSAKDDTFEPADSFEDNPDILEEYEQKINKGSKPGSSTSASASSKKVPASKEKAEKKSGRKSKEVSEKDEDEFVQEGVEELEGGKKGGDDDDDDDEEQEILSKASSSKKGGKASATTEAFYQWKLKVKVGKWIWKRKSNCIKETC